uniref:Defensin n=1 Tax=Argas monolakensis TaxID=34602 RepID=Q09JE4_ARGMO|nr:Defensin [Argas monolakensis]
MRCLTVTFVCLLVLGAFALSTVDGRRHPTGHDYGCPVFQIECQQHCSATFGWQGRCGGSRRSECICRN